MKKTRAIMVAAMMIASSSLSAFAQGQDDARGQPPVKHTQQKPQQGNGGQPQNAQHNPSAQNHQNNQNQSTPNHQHGGDIVPPQANNGRPQQSSQGKQPHRQQADFRKGRPLPQQYRGAGYQVNDWQKHGLKAPPSGHRWMNVNGNYVLIAIATGVIASVIAHQ